MLGATAIPQDKPIRNDERYISYHLLDPTTGLYVHLDWDVHKNILPEYEVVREGIRTDRTFSVTMSHDARYILFRIIADPPEPGAMQEKHSEILYRGFPENDQKARALLRSYNEDMVELALHDTHTGAIKWRRPQAFAHLATPNLATYVVETHNRIYVVPHGTMAVSHHQPETDLFVPATIIDLTTGAVIDDEEEVNAFPVKTRYPAVDIATGWMVDTDFTAHFREEDGTWSSRKLEGLEKQRGWTEPPYVKTEGPFCFLDDRTKVYESPPRSAHYYRFYTSASGRRNFMWLVAPGIDILPFQGGHYYGLLANRYVIWDLDSGKLLKQAAFDDYVTSLTLTQNCVASIRKISKSQYEWDKVRPMRVKFSLTSFARIEAKP
jgi:hypothetical protein